VKGVCSVAESAEKFVEVDDTPEGLVRGDRVEVLLEQRQGMKAVLYGYGLPLILLLAVLFILYAITGREGLSALIALASLVPYYLTVFLLRKRITNSFGFRLRRKI
jgi:positive regulator of sigma E activity